VSVLEPVLPGGLAHGPGLAALRRELERHWCSDTAFWPEEWTPDHPSVGQCAVTSMLVFDRFGGEILRTVNQGVLHYWNLVDGVEVDLTRDQLKTWAPEDEVVEVSRNDVESSGPTLAARYRRLAAALHG
jgi:hypothetical protein